MLVRTCVIAALALVLAIVAALAWFMTGGPKTDYLQVEVFGGLKATVRLYRLTALTQQELYQGEVTLSALLNNNRFTEITNLPATWPQDTTDPPNTAAYLASGNGDYYKITVTLQDLISAQMSVSLIDISWNKKLSTETRAQLSGHIWVESLLYGDERRYSTNMFEWWDPETDSLHQESGEDYKGEVTFALRSIGANPIFFYWLYLDHGFTIDLNDKSFLMTEPIFTVGHVKVTLK